MIFNYYEENFNLSNYKFQNIDIVAVGSILSLRIGNREVPYTASSSDKSYNKCLKKMYSEHLERVSVGVNYKNKKIYKDFDLLNEKHSFIERGALSYGKSTNFGYVDTTGTASGNSNSTQIIKKAISELLEKNELFLFWYCNSGARVPKEQTLSYEKKLGIETYENYIFKTQNLSNWPTVICIMFKDGYVVGTGVSCNEKFESALLGALREAKILRVLNSYKLNSMYKFNPAENDNIYKFISNYEGCIHKPFLTKLIPKYNLKLCPLIQDLRICFINGREKGIGKTVTVYSNALFKCIPTKQNLKYCKNIPIVMTKCDIDAIERKIDCFIN